MKIIPSNGIYARVCGTFKEGSPTGSGRADEKDDEHRFRPTVDGKKRVIEVNIFDFDEEIYGDTLKVFVKKYLREEIKFNS